jgi:hypothetical protein
VSTGLTGGTEAPTPTPGLTPTQDPLDDLGSRGTDRADDLASGVLPPERGGTPSSGLPPER